VNIKEWTRHVWFPCKLKKYTVVWDNNGNAVNVVLCRRKDTRRCSYETCKQKEKSDWIKK